MTTTYSRNGDGTGTFSMVITAEQTRFEELLYNFGLSIYGEFNKDLFDALSVQEQLNVIEDFLKKVARARDKSIQEWIAEQNLNIIDLW